MARFAVAKSQFVRCEDGDAQDNGEGLPAPMLAKIQARRMAGIREAKAVLEHLPGPGESLHALCTARMDLTDVIAALIGRKGRIERMSIATLGYNEKNLVAMLGWLDAKAVGSITLLASIFFRAHKGALWTETLKEFRTRGQRAACCHSHAKVVTMAFADGAKMVIHGSANLCGNGSGREQFALDVSDELHDWHAQWIEEMAAKA
jgi:hypothetical protein